MVNNVRLAATLYGSLLKAAVVPQQCRGIHSLDAKWIDKWRIAGTKTNSAGPDQSEHDHAVDTRLGSSNRPFFYQLPMFPYPSGRLHIGHLRVYAISDALARFRRMNGFHVVHPIGWDAFGLPAENAAIENGINAADWTYRHIDVMRNQLKRMMISFDWDREVITCSPEYYKHTQRIFLEMYKAGLAYRRNASVNWDPVDKTVLANEQIDSQGRSWRSGAIAEKRELEQWFLKITDYAADLEKDLDLLEDWPEKVKRMQKQWIGLSSGVEVKFGDQLHAFTTKIETLPGVKFVSIGEDHPLAQANTANTRPNGLVEGVEATHPLSGEPLPVYVAPYVISEYGTGAVMGVPAHDERDQTFWESARGAATVVSDLEPVVDYANNQLVCDPYRGMSIDDARAAITEKLGSLGRGEETSHLRIRDWLVSRQRFWGAPIPMVHCSNCGVVPVPESELPVELPKDSKNVPLSQNEDWLKTKCPSCGKEAERDPDTMDTFMDSSWYFFRYLDPRNNEEPFSKQSIEGKMPVNCYIGGIEHAILHLLYSRFLAKFLARSGHWSGGDLKGEPFRKLVTQGMVHGKTYRDKDTGRYLKRDEVFRLLEEQKQGSTAMDNVTISMEKMSKSKYNGVDPLDVIERFGADATRAHMLFQAPIPDTLNWDEDKIVGVERWLLKIENLGAKLASTDAVTQQQQQQQQQPRNEDVDTWNEAQSLFQSITASFGETLSLNTVISDYMKFTKCVTELEKSNKKLAADAYEILLKAIAPVCPAHADEMWERFLVSSKKPWRSIHTEAWPVMKPLARTQTKSPFRVLLDSRPLKASVYGDENSTQSELLAQVDLQGKEIKRMIFKPKIKLLSIVTK